MLAPVLTPRDNGLDVEVRGRRFFVDARQHQLEVVTAEGVHWQLGASRAGVKTLADLLEDTFGGERLTLEDRGALANAAGVALRKMAAKDDLRAPAVERKVDAIRATPLIYSAPFLLSGYLRDDVASFRPARVAVAMYEDDLLGDSTPEGTERAVEDLKSWRAIYARGGGAKKALNKTLAEHGEALSVDALWGLRRTPLGRVAASREHAEVLGTLGGHGRPEQVRSLVHTVESAQHADLLQAIQRVRDSRLVRGAPATALAEVLLALGNARVQTSSLDRLLTVALEAMRDGVANYDLETTRPPIPLPDDPKIRFLRTARCVVEEGEHMNHCVATRFWDAFEGRGYLFHVATLYGDVTVQMNPDGTVYEARGPDNAHHPGVAVAAQALLRWGQGLVFGSVDGSQNVWRGGPSAPSGVTPLRHLGECIDLHTRVLDRVLASDRETWLRWFPERVKRAARGEAWLVWSDVETMPVVRVLNERGRVLEQSTQVLDSGKWRRGFRRFS